MSHDDSDNDQPADDHTDRRQQILEARAQALARPLETERLASEFLEVLTFRVADEYLALDTRCVREVLQDVEIVPLPGDTSPLLGVTNLRGELLAVMSLMPSLEIQPPTSAAAKKSSCQDWVIVVGTDQPQFGIAVSDVTEVRLIQTDSIHEASRQTRLRSVPFIRGVTEESCIVLDGLAMLDDAHFIIDMPEG